MYQRTFQLRIIGGNLKGKKLFSPQGKTVRPTADRLRETIFNILSDKVPGAVVLDLFSGTGAFGIESLSREAKQAVFVEKSRDALHVIQRNIQAGALEKQTQVIKWDIAKNLNCLRRIPFRYDLVFMDPPYDRDMVQKGLNNLYLSGCVHQEGCIVIEHSASEPIPENTKEFAIFDQRKYGKTLVTFLTNVL
ncbi:MAG: 16S rRNA (guanine(966)-N(2))-methyltransferase RsmD [Desulfobacterales bacterium]|nr:16S rRNA (guanine(966)-N(2))-methyltransferase RsmD [Desulfobacterales bacterium]